MSEASLTDITEVLNLLGLFAPGENLELGPWSFTAALGWRENTSLSLELQFQKGSKTASGLRAAGGGGGGINFPFLPWFPLNYQHSNQAVGTRLGERKCKRGVNQAGCGRPGEKVNNSLFGALWVTELSCAGFPPGRGPGWRAGDASREAARKVWELQAEK